MKWSSMFNEPGTDKASMTRVVAWEFTQVICIGIVVMAFRDQLGTVGLPFAGLAVVTLLAVPAQAFLKFLNTWLKSAPGKKLMDKLVEKVVPGFGSISGSGAPNLKTTTTVEQNSPEEAK